jgi:hypothetical protein
MNCTVCGSELERGKDFCPNCGTKLVEMPGHGKGGSTFGIHNQQMQASQYQNELNFTKDYNNVTSKKSSGGSGSRAGGIIAVIILVLIAGVFAVYWFLIRPNQTKVYDLGKFSIEMPTSMEEGGSDDVVGAMQSFSSQGVNMDVGGYENDDVVFVYMVMDFTNYQEVQTGGMTLSSLSAETMIYQVEKAMQMMSDYEVISSSDDTLKCKYKSSEGNIVYMNLSVQKKDKVFYIFDMGCKEEDMGKYQAKIDKWMKTIILN